MEFPGSRKRFRKKIFQEDQLELLKSYRIRGSETTPLPITAKEKRFLSFKEAFAAGLNIGKTLYRNIDIYGVFSFIDGEGSERFLHDVKLATIWAGQLRNFEENHV